MPLTAKEGNVLLEALCFMYGDLFRRIHAVGEALHPNDPVAREHFETLVAERSTYPAAKAAWMDGYRHAETVLRPIVVRLVGGGLTLQEFEALRRDREDRDR